MEWDDSLPELLLCTVCEDSFVFSSGDKTQFALLGRTHRPKRCEPCRIKGAAAPVGGGKGPLRFGLSVLPAPERLRSLHGESTSGLCGLNANGVVLLVGEMDFSFTRDVCAELSPSTWVLSTCFLREPPPKLVKLARHNLKTLLKHPTVRVLFGVDATNITQTIAHRSYFDLEEGKRRGSRTSTSSCEGINPSSLNATSSAILSSSSSSLSITKTIEDELAIQIETFRRSLLSDLQQSRNDERSLSCLTAEQIHNKIRDVLMGRLNMCRDLIVRDVNDIIATHQTVSFFASSCLPSCTSSTSSTSTFCSPSCMLSSSFPTENTSTSSNVCLSPAFESLLADDISEFLQQEEEPPLGRFDNDINSCSDDVLTLHIRETDKVKSSCPSPPWEQEDGLRVSSVVFCFPRAEVGSGVRDGNTKLLTGFFKSVQQILQPNGRVVMLLHVPWAHGESQDQYVSWGVEGIARSCGFVRVEVHPFELSHLPSYTPRDASGRRWTPLEARFHLFVRDTT